MFCRVVSSAVMLDVSILRGLISFFPPDDGVFFHSAGSCGSRIFGYIHLCYYLFVSSIVLVLLGFLNLSHFYCCLQRGVVDTKRERLSSLCRRVVVWLFFILLSRVACLRRLFVRRGVGIAGSCVSGGLALLAAFLDRCRGRLALRRHFVRVQNAEL